MAIPDGFELVSPVPDGFEELDGETHIQMINGVPTPVRGGLKAPVKPERSVMDYVKGAGEVALNAASSIPAMIPGAVMEAFGNNQGAKDFMEKYTYAPRTELGQEGAEGLGELVNNVGVPMLGVHLPAPKGIRKYNGTLKKLTKLQDIPEGFEPVAPKGPGFDAMDRDVEYGQIPPDATIPSNRMGGYKLTTDLSQFALDENGIPVRKNAVETPPDLSRGATNEGIRMADEPARGEMDAAMAEANGPLLRPEQAGSERFMGAMEGPGEPIVNTVAPREPLRIPESQRGAIDLGKPKVELVERADGIDAFVDGQKVGYLNDNLPRGMAKRIGENANVDIVKVEPNFVGLGVGKALYDRFADRHDGNIAPSGKTSPSAWRLWQRNFPAKVTEFVSQESARLESGAPVEQVLSNITDPGIRRQVVERANPLRVLNSDPIRVPVSQRGGVNIRAIDDAVKKMINKVSPPDLPTGKLPVQKNTAEVMAKVPGLGEAAKNWIPEDTPTAAVKDAILKEGAENGTLHAMNLRSGIQSTAAQRQSTLLTEGGRWLINAAKRAEKNVEDFVKPVEKATRRLTSIDVKKLSEVMREESSMDARYTSEQLGKRGIDPKQEAVYNALREMQDKAFDAQNAARVKQGMEPITRLDAYLAASWGGRFTIPIYNKSGRLIWMIGEKTQKEALRAKDWLKKNGVEMDEARAQVGVRGKQQGPRGLFEDDFASMRQMIDNTDPESIKAYEAYGQSKHFEDKTGVRGYKGDRPWNNSVDEAYTLLHSQMDYAKNAFKWAEMQEATAKVKEVLADKQIQDLQPSNAEYLRQRTRQELGYGEWNAIRALEDAVTEQLGKVGIAPGQGGQAVGMAKSLFVLQKLAANLGFFGGQLVQTLSVIPEHAWLSDRGYKHNAIKTTAAAAMDWAAGLGNAKMDYLSKGRGPEMKMTKLGKDAWDYMKDNGIVNRTVVDEASGMGQNHLFEMFAHGVGIGIRGTENFIRGNAFLSFAHHLEQSGKFTDKKAMFQMAEEAVERSMVSWRTSERAMAFEKMGTVGSAASTLKSYLVNFWNNMGRYGEEAMKGNVKPLLYTVALQQLLFGTSNIPGMQDANALWEAFKKQLPDAAFKHVKDLDIQKTLISKMPDWLAYGGVSKLTGVNFASRGTVGLGDSLSLDGMFPFLQDGFNTAKAVAGAAINPNQTTVNQAAYNLAPAGPLQGMASQMDAFKAEPQTRPDGTQAFQKPKNLANHDFDYARTPEQMEKKNLGFTALKEAREKELKFLQGSDDRELSQRRDGNVTKAWDAIVRGDKTDLNKAIDNYMAFDGDPKQFENMLEREAMKMHASREQLLALKSAPNITDMKRLQNIRNLLGEVR